MADSFFLNPLKFISVDNVFFVMIFEVTYLLKGDWDMPSLMRLEFLFGDSFDCGDWNRKIGHF